MSNLTNTNWLEIKKEYLEELAWNIYQKGLLHPCEDKRLLLLDKEDAEIVYEEWGRACAK